MSDTIETIAEHLRAQREKQDPISQSQKEQIPDVNRIIEALSAVRAMVLDQTRSEQLTATVQVVHGLVSALAGANKATRFLEQLPDVRHCIAMDVEAACVQ